jgi:hypothetical protein
MAATMTSTAIISTGTTGDFFGVGWLEALFISGSITGKVA